MGPHFRWTTSLIRWYIILVTFVHYGSAFPRASFHGISRKVVAAPVWRKQDSYSVEHELLRRQYLTKRQSVSQPLYNPPVKIGYYANGTFSCSLLLMHSDDRNSWPTGVVADRYWVK
jgi:hypothetical protein